MPRVTNPRGRLGHQRAENFHECKKQLRAAHHQVAALLGALRWLMVNGKGANDDQAWQQRCRDIDNYIKRTF